jgi:hypothetical protein
MIKEIIKNHFVTINEMVIKNKQLIRSYAKEIEREVQKVIKSPDVKFMYNKEYLDADDIVLNICYLKEKEIDLVEKIAQKWQKKLIENNISIKHQIPSGSYYDKWKIVYAIKFKDVKTERVKPEKYVYHFTNSKENKNNILKYGLIPKTNVNWDYIDYPDAIFAINGDFGDWRGNYVFRIDTTNLKNKWWYDLNFRVGSPQIMTFEPIGPEYLKLLDFRGELNRRRKVRSDIMGSVLGAIKNNDLDFFNKNFKYFKSLENIEVSYLLSLSIEYNKLELLKILLNTRKDKNFNLLNLGIEAMEQPDKTILKYLINNYKIDKKYLSQEILARRIDLDSETKNLLIKNKILESFNYKKINQNKIDTLFTVKKLIKEQLILERRIAQLKANIFINFNLRHDPSEHSKKRQWRHVAEKGVVIHDVDILNLVKKVLDDIAFKIAVDEIKDKVRFIISDTKYPYLNIVIEPEMVDPYQWILNIVTVMNKKDFEIGRDQLQLFGN